MRSFCVDGNGKDKERGDESHEIRAGEGKEEPVDWLVSHLEMHVRRESEQDDETYRFLREDTNVDGVGDDSEEVDKREQVGAEEELSMRELDLLALFDVIF